MAGPWLSRMLLLVLLAMLLAPQAAACTSTRGPHSPVRFVAVRDGATVLDLATSISVGPNDLCGYDGTPRLEFDGRYAAWLAGQGLHVVEVSTGQEWTVQRGVLTTGHVVLHQGYPSQANVTILDLANGTSRVVNAPSGQAFVANVEGAVVAFTSDGSSPERVSVLDPVSATWRLQDLAVPAAIDPWAIRYGERDWIALGMPESSGEVPMLHVPTGELTTLATGKASLAGVRDGRLYLLSAPTMGSTESPRTAWSLALPNGDDRRDGAMPGPAAQEGLSVSFVIGASTDTSTSGSTTPLVLPDDDGLGSTTPGDSTATMTTTGDDGVLDVSTTYALLLVAPALAAWAMRRRL